MREHNLKVGEGAIIKKNVFASSYSVVYGGMPSDKTYSLVIIYSSGYHCMAYNLYCPLKQKEINTKKGRIRVLHVSSDSIRLTIEN